MHLPKVGARQIRYSLGIAVDEVLIHFSVNSQKQASAFPPNFIHSLDATHMLLTALECRVRSPSCRMRELLTIVVVDPRLDFRFGS